MQTKSPQAREEGEKIHRDLSEDNSDIALRFGQ